MKNLISILFVALSFYSCTESLDGTNADQNCGDITNVAYESFSFCGQFKENPTKPVYYVMSSYDDIQKLFTVCPTFDVLTLPDFTQKRILGLCSGPKPTAGYTIKIQSVIQNDCQILVEYYETAPAENEPVATVITYPTDYIVLPKSNKPIVFSKVSKIIDYAILGTYAANPAATQCVGNCNAFYKIEKYKVLQYLDVNNFPNNFGQSYKALVYADDYAGFLLKVPTEIKNLKGQTKTYGTPGVDDHSGFYFEWSQEGVVTKIYFDVQNTTDQTTEVVAFKKVIQDKITELKTKS